MKLKKTVLLVESNKTSKQIRVHSQNTVSLSNEIIDACFETYIYLILIKLNDPWIFLIFRVFWHFFFQIQNSLLAKIFFSYYITDFVSRVFIHHFKVRHETTSLYSRSALLGAKCLTEEEEACLYACMHGARTKHDFFHSFFFSLSFPALPLKCKHTQAICMNRIEHEQLAREDVKCGWNTELSRYNVHFPIR